MAVVTEIRELPPSGRGPRKRFVGRGYTADLA